MGHKFYQILGLDMNASADDIKKAYKKLAIQNHPDKGGNEEEFKKINEAYSILSDPEKKRMYDQFGDSGLENGFGGMNMNMNGMNMNDLFSNIFGKQRPRTMDDIIYDLEISLKDCYFGCEKKLRINIDKKCSKCSGTCPQCGGRGTIPNIINQIFIQIATNSPCPKCEASGYCSTGCSECSGGTIRKEEILHIPIRKGIKTGETFVFQEMGKQSFNPNIKPGNLVVLIRVNEKDSIFKRNGNNLVYKTSITLEDAIVGKDISIQHFEKPIEINTSLFGIIDPSMKYYMKGLGIDGADLELEFSVTFPKKVLNQETKDLFKLAFNSVGQE